jgi:hypothetical protein
LGVGWYWDWFDCCCGSEGVEVRRFVVERKVSAASVAALVVAAVVQAVQDQGVTVDAVVVAVVTAGVAAVVGWLRRNGRLSPSTLEAADSAGQ